MEKNQISHFTVLTSCIFEFTKNLSKEIDIYLAKELKLNEMKQKQSTLSLSTLSRATFKQKVTIF